MLASTTECVHNACVTVEAQRTTSYEALSMPTDIQQLYDIRESFPFPLYCTRLDGTGQFRFINDAFSSFLGYESSTLCTKSASALYVKTEDRIPWKHQLLNSNGAISWVFEYLLGPAKEGVSIHVLDTAIRLRDENEGDFAVGLLCDIDSEVHKWQLSANRNAAFCEILNMIDEGVHQIDSEGRLVFVSQSERDLLKIDSDWLNGKPKVCELSPKDHEAKQARVMLKLKLGDKRKHLTLGEHRPFVEDPPADNKLGHEKRIVPVNIFDVPVVEPDAKHGRRNAEIFTVVTDARIPPDITRLLHEFGPRNPLLEEAGITTFIKLSRHFALRETPGILESLSKGKDADLLFTYGNKLFIEELKQLSKVKPEINVNDFEDILGRTESDLWGKYAAAYSEADRQVMSNHGQEDQRIERHPSVSASNAVTTVQTLKLPVYDPEDPEVVIGVQGFYWDVSGAEVRGRHGEIRRRLENLYQPLDILNTIPVPVYMKDFDLKFVYANAAYLADLKKVQERDLDQDHENKDLIKRIRNLHDIIGFTDKQLFREQLAAKYESDDERVRKGETVDLEEEHGGRVKVIKVPVKRGESIIGVQGIFWYVTEEEDFSNEIWIDWNSKPPFLHVLDGGIEIKNSNEWKLFECFLPTPERDLPYQSFVDAGILKRVTTREDRKPLYTLVSKLNKQLDVRSIPLNIKVVNIPQQKAYKLQVSERRA